jgi:hypothetical protein
MNSLTYFYALPKAAPFPTIIKGLWANPITFKAFLISEEEGQKDAG